MDKKFLIAIVVMFVLSMLIGFTVHGVLLHADYAQLQNLYRTEEDQMSYMHWMLLAHVLIAAAFVWIYQQGRKDTPWLAQGIRYGIAIAVLTTVPWYLIYYAVQPLPGMLVVKQIVFDSIGTVVMGVVVAWLYRGPAAATS
ncbi:MAG: hypothetical protein HYR49_11775 [Gammaproteobacteria bacterium]|nr:hypothetical protein [Gammaproteobacteria bacterium]